MAIYSTAIFDYHRRRTREVKVGDVGIGGDNPIRVQSMTISDTKDTAAVVAETQGLVEAGCEIVRITAPTIHHAENLKNIKAELTQAGIKVPLVADIHFTPQAAMIAADYVEKVRINPGNYADRKVFAVKEYTDQEYQEELDHMAEKFIPLVKKCKAHGVAMRIGTNHGSLSDRIMNRFGDTPEGMVESALEFVRLCESESYHEIILSMKASSPFIMITAYRLLAQRMRELNMDYPFHLGVTEAGEGEDGRIKSAIGIGSLLEDGIGDTIRVSLTEDSIHEIPVARQLVKKFNRDPYWEKGDEEEPKLNWRPTDRSRRTTEACPGEAGFLGKNQTLRVIATWDVEQEDPQALWEYLKNTHETEERGDLLYLRTSQGPETLLELKDKIQALVPELKIGFSTTQLTTALEGIRHFDAVIFQVTPDTIGGEITQLAEEAFRHQKLVDLRFPSVPFAMEQMQALRTIPPVILSLETDDPLHDYRKLSLRLSQEKILHPLHLYIKCKSFEDCALEVASILGGLLMDGMGDSVEVADLLLKESLKLSFNILQACRLRISKAEFIACPSCGRTLFDLQETTQRIKVKTQHLKGVKIAIMGCIVNGPGEMADADFGYVGGGPGKIHLYVGKECVEKNIPSEVADEKLIDLIKKHGKWVEPTQLKAAP
ncbi:MAG: (E)-4-hydroxy-3-methylbut-2-enyl-diphosphate synthase [bacterium]|nr:(E)-4-hydroxy-3-methylbut-2-enyl-diphosphate synthase [bacterium]